MYNFCAVPYSRTDRLGLKSGQNDISDFKQPPSPSFESSSLYRKEDEGGGQEEDPDVSLSRLGQNPEILLFPIPRQ